MVSLVQVSQYTVISAWNSMITPAVKWFVNGDIMTTNKLPGMYFCLCLKSNKKGKKVHAVFLSSRIYTDFVWGI